MIRSALAALVLTSAMAAPAFAESRTYEARLVAPVAAPTSFIAGGAVWRCADTTCRASRDSGGMTMAGCRRVVREVGAVASFGSDAAPYSAERLAACNGAAAQTQAGAPTPVTTTAAAQ